MFITAVKPPQHRSVRCYHCLHWLDVPAKAVQLSCPLCYKPIKVDDVVIDRVQTTGQVRTCGVVVIGAKGNLSASLVESGQGVQVLGKLVGRVRCAGPVVLGPRAIWNGDCQAASIVIQPGATILGGRFSISPQVATPA